MDVEALREAARSGALAAEPEVTRPRPTPAESMEQAFAKLGKVCAKAAEQVKLVLDEAWMKLSGEDGPPGYGAQQLLLAIAQTITREQVVKTGIGPVVVDIPTIADADAAIAKMSADIEGIARASGMSADDVREAAKRLITKPPPLPGELMAGLAGKSSPTEVIKSTRDARAMFGEGALYAGPTRIGPIIRASEHMSGSAWAIGKGGREIHLTVGLADRGPVEVTALYEARLDSEKRIELRLGSAVAGVVNKVVRLDQSWADSILGAMKDDRDWEHVVTVDE